MPKILVTGISTRETWYREDIGKFHKFVSEDETSYRTTLGGRILKRDAILIYTEAEYNEVVQQKEKAIDDLAKHAQTIVDMQKEKIRLQNEVDQGTPRQKVELPRDVYNAIESFRDNGWSPEDIFLISERPEDGEWAQVLYKWTRSTSIGRLKLMRALVNGYTVEQSPEERLQEKIEALIQEWYCSPSAEDLAKGVKPLASRIVEQAKQLT